MGKKMRRRRKKNSWKKFMTLEKFNIEWGKKERFLQQ